MKTFYARIVKNLWFDKGVGNFVLMDKRSRKAIGVKPKDIVLIFHGQKRRYALVLETFKPFVGFGVIFSNRLSSAMKLRDKELVIIQKLVSYQPAHKAELN